MWLQIVIDDGIVDIPFCDHDHIPWDLLGIAAKQFDEGSSANARAVELAMDVNSRRHQESHFDPATQPNTAEYWLVELARIAVPMGNIGFLGSLEQVLWDANGAYYPSSSDYWGNPYFLHTDVSNCRWYLMIDRFDSADQPRVNISSALPIPTSRIPGAPYPELHEIDGLWYPAHNSSSTHLKWLIGQNRILRYFFLSPPTSQYTWNVSGRLRAYTQSTYSPEAQKNAREIY